MKRILITGSSGFIGGHLSKRLMDEGSYVIGVDIVKPKFPEFAPNQFVLADLREQDRCYSIFQGRGIQEVYNLGCLMGGMGFIGKSENDYDVMIGSSMIVANVIDQCLQFGVEKTLYSSSACIYPEYKQLELDALPLKEEDWLCAWPDLLYGWQKLGGELMYKAAIGKGLDSRIVRFHNVYGTHTIYDGGKEKFPAAVSRKVAKAKDGESVEIWGDGNQIRSFMYIDDCIEGMIRLMNSSFTEPLNLGSNEAISVNDLTKMIIEISGKNLTIKNIDGIQGVRARNSDNTLCNQILGWQPPTKLIEGMTKTYNWINEDINGKL